ncbi:acyl-CoA thioesterase [bacterium]|nr:acyl-CoA thioesterase [bacterium]
MEQSQRSITLRFLAGPSEINLAGNVHGGSVMKWIDEAGYTCAAGWSGQSCVTIYVSGIRFYHPIRIGNLVEIQATLIYTGRTSMHIAIDVYAADPKQPKRQKTTHCIIVFVAVNQAGEPSPVPSWEPETDKDRMLHSYAQKLMALRKGIEEEMNQFRVG